MIYPRPKLNNILTNVLHLLTRVENRVLSLFTVTLEFRGILYIYIFFFYHFKLFEFFLYYFSFIKSVTVTVACIMSSKCSQNLLQNSNISEILYILSVFPFPKKNGGGPPPYRNLRSK